MEPPFRDSFNDSSEKHLNVQNNCNPNPQYSQTFSYLQPYPPNYSYFPQYLPNYPYFSQGPMFEAPPINGNAIMPSIAKSSQLPSNSSSSHASSTSVDEVEISEVCPHPTGQNATKWKGKERCTNDTDVMLNKLKQQIKRMQQYMDKMKRRKDIDDRKFLIKEYNVLMKDTSTMTKEQLSYHQQYSETIKRSWNNQMSDSSHYLL
nr:uncharacterized protein LOC109179053 [Ipomoea trifida]